MCITTCIPLPSTYIRYFINLQGQTRNDTCACVYLNLLSYVSYLCYYIVYMFMYVCSVCIVCLGFLLSFLFAIHVYIFPCMCIYVRRYIYIDQLLSATYTCTVLHTTYNHQYTLCVYMYMYVVSTILLKLCTCSLDQWNQE